MTETTYRTRASEVGQPLIDSIRTLYGDKEIEIIVSEHQDQTDFLLRSQENRKHLLEAVDDIRNGRNLVVSDQEQFR